MVALDKNTGAVVWRAKEWTDPCGFSSAIVVEVGGIRQYVQQASKGVAGISAKDGKVLWKIDIPGYRTAVIPSPVFQDNIVYVTSGYNAGSMGIRLTKEGEGIKTETIYANKVISNKHGNVVLINGYIYGHSEATGGSWVCQNFKTGESVWSQRNQEIGMTGNGSIFGIGDRLLCFDEKKGLLVVAAASPDGWKEFGKMELPERMKDDPSQDKATWTIPVIANGNLYLRDHDLLFCFDLKK
jgi:outer membrane protein assembly factor BamB